MRGASKGGPVSLTADTLVGAAADPKVLLCQRQDSVSAFPELTAFLLRGTWPGSTCKS